MAWKLFKDWLKRLVVSRKRTELQSVPLGRLEQKIHADPTLANAFRLMQDADLLFNHGRYSSVVALAVLAMEEIGKFLLAEWAEADRNFSYDKRKLHQMKQGAVAALFMIDGARRAYKDENFDFSAEQSPERMEDLMAIVTKGLEKETEFAGFVKSKAIEFVKWSGIYYDDALAEKGIEPSKITEANAHELMQHSGRAFKLLADEGNIILARYAFPFILAPKSPTKAP